MQGTRLYVLVDEMLQSAKVSLEKFNENCKEFVINCVGDSFIYDRLKVDKGDTVYAVLIYNYDSAGLDCLGVFTEKPDVDFIMSYFPDDVYLERICERVL